MTRKRSLPRKGSIFIQDEKIRYSVYVSEPIEEALNQLKAKTKISKNSLINLAVYKLLNELDMINSDKEAIEIINELKGIRPKK